MVKTSVYCDFCGGEMKILESGDVTLIHPLSVRFAINDYCINRDHVCVKCEKEIRNTIDALLFNLEHHVVVHRIPQEELQVEIDRFHHFKSSSELHASQRK